MAGIALNLARLQGQVEGVERAFQRAVPNSVAVLNRLREATHGTVTDLELMQKALLAQNYGISLQALPKLLEFAAVRAQQTGQNVDYLVNSIIDGIGRKSLRVLDNLQLSTTAIKEELGGVSMEAASVAEVSEAMGRIATREMEKMGGFAETAATEVDKLNVSVEALRVTLAKKIESGGLISLLNDALENINLAIKSKLLTNMRALYQEQARLMASADALRVIESKAFKELGDNQQKKFDFIQQEMNSRLQIIGKYNDTIAALKEERKILEDKNPFDKRIDSLDRQIKAYNNNKYVIASTILVLKEYLKEIEKANTVEAAKPASGIIERKREEIKALQEAIEKTNNLSDLGPGGKLTKQLEIAQAELADLLRSFHDFKIKPFKLEIDNATESLSNMDKVIKRIEGQMQTLANLKFTSPTLPAVYTPTFWDELSDAVTDSYTQISDTAFGIFSDQAKSLVETELQGYQDRIQGIRDYYSNQQKLAGDNQALKDRLRKQEEAAVAKAQRMLFEKEKDVRRKQAIIDGAAGIVKAFATFPYPAALVMSVLIAAQTASQIAIINRQQPRFAKGVIDLKGPGTGTSDSIPAWLSKGESVIRADRTRDSKKLLTAINDGEISDRRISDDVLNRLHLSSDGVTELNDDRIVDRLNQLIKKQSHPDYMAHANILFEVRRSADGLHKKIRRKAMG